MDSHASRQLGQLVVLCALASLSTSAAHAESLALAKAEQAYAQLDYDKVMPLLQQAIGEPATDDERVRIYELAATMHVTYERPAEATQAFVKLLELRADYRVPPQASPKIVAAFDQARAQFLQHQQQATAASAPAQGTEAEGETGEPLLAQWWFWGGAGAVALAAVAGASVLAYLLTRPTYPTTDYGTYPLMGTTP